MQMAETDANTNWATFSAFSMACNMAIRSLSRSLRAGLTPCEVRVTIIRGGRKKSMYV